MRNIEPALLALLVVLAACNPQQQAQVTQGLATQPGQLFCAIAVGSGQIIAPIVAAKTTGATQAEAILVTNETAALVQQQCAAAAVAVGGQGAAPVAPPANAASLAPVAIKQ
jgi:hypothetical protein